MLPSVQITTIDGALGIMPANTGDIMAVLGPGTGGTLAVDTPAAFARQSDAIAALGAGPTAESTAYAIENTGKPNLVVRTGATTAGDYGTVDDDGVAGTSVITTDGAVDPVDDFDVYIVFTNGGTVGTAGILYKYSLDGGRTLSAALALGTANTITLPGSVGVKVNLAAGTLVTGDFVTFRTTAPKWNGTELDSALLALKNTTQKWDFVQIVGALDATSAATVAAWLTSLHAAGKKKWAIGHFRRPNDGETEAQYLAAWNTAFSAFADTSLIISAGWVKTLSSVSRRTYKRPVSFAAAARFSQVRPHIDIARLDLGPLPGVTLSDANGNPDDHDEAIFPGLDDARALTLRTHEGYQGAYVTNPRVMAPTGSDFVYAQYRRVMNVACAALDAFFKRRLSVELLLDPKTGFILESEAQEIEGGAEAAMRTAIMVDPMASSLSVTLSRTDNVPSTGTLTVTARVQPLGYPKQIVINLGFYNPALRVAA